MFNCLLSFDFCLLIDVTVVPSYILISKNIQINDHHLDIRRFQLPSYILISIFEKDSDFRIQVNDLTVVSSLISSLRVAKCFHILISSLISSF